MSAAEGVTLAAFLAARLDEDEAIAREAAGLTECWVAEEPAIGVVLVDGEPLIEGHITGLTAHIALHDPSRVLREIVGKRKILTEHQKVTKLAGLTEQELGFLGWYREWVLKNLAAPYSDHPGWNPDWAA